MSPLLHLKPEEVDTPEKRAKYSVTLVGCGQKAIFYALAFAEAGFKVTCADADQSVVKRLSKGNMQLGDPQAESLLKSLIRKEQVKATNDLKAATLAGDIVIVTVNAKIDEKKNSDCSEMESACKQVGAALKKGSLVVYAGIAGLGCIENIKETVENTSGLKAGEDFGLAYIPTVDSTRNSPHQVEDKEIAVAANDKFSMNATENIFQTISKKNIKKIANIKTAEIAMLFAVAKRDVNEALANEMAMFCETAGLDYLEIVKLFEKEICETMPTISEETNRNEAYILLENAENLDVKLRLPLLARQVNEDMVRHAANLTHDALRDCGKTLRRAKVALLGSAEPGTAAAIFVELLKAKGAKVSRYDPDCSSAEYSDGESIKKTLNETVEGTDCIVILSGQEHLKRLNLKKLRAIMKSPAAIVDLVGAVEPEKMVGFNYRGLGRGAWNK